ncbi:hypothetical protein Mpsy_0178 [Methanolobus psychrophilus R15]|nr:hypothetical protein Mpsy_0178 [Methanolobus psychrophilus R15]
MDENEVKIYKESFKSCLDFEEVAKEINDYRKIKAKGKYALVQSAGGIPFRYHELGMISKDKAQEEYDNFKKYQRKNRSKARAKANNKAWIKQRDIVLERDGKKCQVCESADNLQVHHIIPFKESQSHEVENLITLCDDCHKIVGKNKLWISADWVDYNPKEVFEKIVMNYLHQVSKMGYEIALGEGVSRYNGPYALWKVAKKGTLKIDFEGNLQEK